MTAPLSPPEPLDARHVLDGFTCGAPTLDEWLVRKALANQVSGASRTFAVCRDRSVVGFYALAAGSVDQRAAPGKLRRNMPDPVPVIVLGRLAVAESEQGSGLGRALLRDALLRCRAAAGQIGVAGILVHALDDRAKAFYMTAGFIESRIEPLVLLARLGDIDAALAPH